MALMLAESLALLATGNFYTQRYLVFALDPTREYNVELVESIIPDVKQALYAMLFVRAFLIAASFKYPVLTKIFYFHTMMFYCLANTLPQDYGRFQVELASAFSLVVYFG